MPKEERVQVFHDYQVNRELMALGAIGCKFLHCLPATRGEDVTDEVADSASSLCWEQAGNRLTAMRGLLVYFTARSTRSWRSPPHGTHWSGFCRTASTADGLWKTAENSAWRM